MKRKLPWLLAGLPLLSAIYAGCGSSGTGPVDNGSNGVTGTSSGPASSGASSGTSSGTSSGASSGYGSSGYSSSGFSSSGGSDDGPTSNSGD